MHCSSGRQDYCSAVIPHVEYEPGKAVAASEAHVEYQVPIPPFPLLMRTLFFSYLLSRTYLVMCVGSPFTATLSCEWSPFVAWS